MLHVVGLCALFICSSAVVTDADANPIRKIVTLLQDMQKEIEVEGAKDKELFDKFMCFCNGGAEGLKKDSADAAMQIETLSAQETQDTAAKAGLEGDLVKHKADRVSATADLDKATALRNKENAEYLEELGDQKSSFEAVSGAIPALEQGMGGASLIQARGSGFTKQLQRALDISQSVSSNDKADVLAFLQGKQGYSPVGGQVVGILKNMKDEMEKNIAQIEKTEEVAVSGYADLKAAKEQEVELNSEAIEVKTKRVGELAVAIVQAADGVSDATTEKADADKFLASLDTQCKEKQVEYAERSKMRSEEVAAISEAISILNDDDALDVFKKAVPSALLQQSSAVASTRKFGFLQAVAVTPDRLQKAEAFIVSAAQLHRSPKLDLLAYTMKTKLRSLHKVGGAVDFGEITKMIENMITVLTTEQADDDKHKTWCQAELASSASEHEASTSKASSLDSSISETSDESATVAEDLASLTAGIAALDKDVAEAAEQRKEEHAEYLEAVSLTEAAIALMGKAKNRLNKFYNPALYKAPPKKELSAEDSIISKLSFAQVHISRHSRVAQPEAPETGTYAKKSQKSGGVVALMNMLVSELEASLADAQHDEKSAQADYVELMAESEATRASDTKSITDKSAYKAELESKLVSLKENKALTVTDLQNLAAYMAEVHGSCDFILENFQLRSDARANEVESLKNAKAVLAGASYA